MMKQWLEQQSKKKHTSLIQLLIKGYLFLILICFLLLSLPFFRNESVSFIDQLFYAVSIVSTTGLAPTTFAETYNLGGQFIALFFIQLGGIGYMALGSFIILKSFKRVPRLSANLLRLEFNLPTRYPLLQFIYSIFIFTILIEALGAVGFYYGFREAGVDQPLWNAIFHSISAFCTAGFSLFSDSLSGFEEYPLITNTAIALSLLGSIGFIVFLDFTLRIIGKRKSITLTSKIILVGTIVIWIGGAILIFLSESTLNHDLNYIKACLFQSMSAHTTVGFNSVDLGALSEGSIFILILVMMLGASPSGTGGGIKTTSITALFAVLKSILKKKDKVTFFNKVIPVSNIYLAISSALFYTFVLSIFTWLLLLAECGNIPFQALLFEAASALSTVGISTGITGDLTLMGKLLIICLMFIGRLGVLTFGFALLKRAPALINTLKEEEIAI